MTKHTNKKIEKIEELPTIKKVIGFAPQSVNAINVLDVQNSVVLLADKLNQVIDQLNQMEKDLSASKKEG